MSDTTCKSDECTYCLSDYDTVRQSFDRCSIELSIDGGGDAFNCYTDLDVDASVFEGGNFWSEGWDIAVNAFGIIAWERFETYPDGTPTTLNDETGWDIAWDIETNRMAELARETFEDYSTGVTMDAGTGWAGAWAVTTNA